MVIIRVFDGEFSSTQMALVLISVLHVINVKVSAEAFLCLDVRYLFHSF